MARHLQLRVEADDGDHRKPTVEELLRLALEEHLRVFGADVEGVEAVLARDVVLAEDDLEMGSGGTMGEQSNEKERLVCGCARCVRRKSGERAVCVCVRVPARAGPPR